MRCLTAGSLGIDHHAASPAAAAATATAGGGPGTLWPGSAAIATAGRARALLLSARTSLRAGPLALRRGLGLVRGRLGSGLCRLLGLCRRGRLRRRRFGGGLARL